jgi:(4S)-4-hydroxy-5-phosphonooxypentane-2,3-dione isomerase
MIIRLVKLTLQASKVPEFLALFKSSEENIKKFRGCRRLFLYRDVNNPDTFFTYSEWDSESDLEFYRNSEVFLSIWKNAKACFSAPAEAWSLNDVDQNV